MPQLDINTYASQIFWLILCFSTLYLVVSKMLIPRLSTIIENRKNHIDNIIEETKNIKKNSEDNINLAESTIKKAKIDAKNLIKKTSLKTKEAYDKKSLAIRNMMKAKAIKAEHEIIKNKNKVLSDLNKASSSLALIIIKNIQQNKNINEQKIINKLINIK